MVMEEGMLCGGEGRWCDGDVWWWMEGWCGVGREGVVCCGGGVM